MALAAYAASRLLTDERSDVAQGDQSEGETMREVSAVIIHHTGASESAWGWDDIRADHLERGYSDVGYHYGVSESGLVLSGRDEQDTGAHALGANTGSIGVALLGDYDGGELPSVEQLDGVADLLAELLDAHGLTLDDVKPHNEVGATDTVCPGFDWDWFVEQMQGRGLS